MFPGPVRRRALWLSLCLVAVLPSPAHSVTPNGRLQIIHLDVGQGDGAVLITPLGQVVMIDNGTPETAAATVAQLAALGVTHVDLHFASHYHADHIGAFGAMVAAGITIGAGWDRGESYTTSYYSIYVSRLGAARHTLTRGQVFTLDATSTHPVLIRCVDLAGAGVASDEENARSVVLKVSYGEFDAVFGGDLTGMKNPGGDIESVVGPEVGPVEVYKVHHHGSRYSTNDNFLAATTPKIAVIQCGTGSSYGHPTPDALGRLHAHGVRTYWNERGSGATPLAGWDVVANGQVVIQATWEPAGVDTVRGPGFADTFTNSGTVVADQVSPVVALLAPRGGETIDAWSTASIRWSATDNVGVVSVDLFGSFDDGATWNPIALGEANDGAYPWAVPGVSSTQALVAVVAHDAANNGGSDLSDPFTIYEAPGGAFLPAGLPRPLVLQNRPNPFNETTTIGFGMPAAGLVRLTIHAVDGRLVRTLAEREYPRGYGEVTWDGRSDAGRPASNGVYFCRFEAGPVVQTRRILLAR